MLSGSIPPLVDQLTASRSHSQQAAYLGFGSTVHVPDPIMTVAVPSFMLVPAYVTFLLSRSISYDTPPAVALIQRSPNRWIDRGAPLPNETLFDASSIQKCKFSLRSEELLPAGLSVITTLFVMHVR